MKNEGELIAYIDKLTKARGGECIKISCRGRRGLFDLMIWLPLDPVFFIEGKHGSRGVVSPQQRWWLKRAKLLNKEAHVIRTKEEADELFASKNTQPIAKDLKILYK